MIWVIYVIYLSCLSCVINCDIRLENCPLAVLRVFLLCGAGRLGSRLLLFSFHILLAGAHVTK